MHKTKTRVNLLIFLQTSMKRRHQPIDSDHFAATTSLKKRFVKVPPTAEPLPCKFKLLRHWELTEEASRFLSMGNKIE